MENKSLGVFICFKRCGVVNQQLNADGTITKELAMALKEAAYNGGINSKETAEEIGINTGVYSRILSGKTTAYKHLHNIVAFINKYNKNKLPPL